MNKKHLAQFVFEPALNKYKLETGWLFDIFIVLYSKSTLMDLFIIHYLKS